jgi:ABC-type transporter MlaC component
MCHHPFAQPQGGSINMMIQTRILLTFTLLALAMPVWAGEATQAVEALVKVFTEWNGTSSDKESLAEAAKHIDYGLMSQRVLGQESWNGLSSKQKHDFLTSFRNLVEKRYYPRWHRIFSHASITYLGERQSQGDTLVRTRIKNGDSVQDVLWTISKSAGEEKVVNLQVGARDLVQRAGQRFQKKLAKSNFDDFLVWIKKESVRASSAEVGEEDGKNRSPS